MTNHHIQDGQDSQYAQNNKHAQEKLTKTLDQLLNEAEAEEATGLASSCAKNELYDGHIEEMLNLVRCIARIAPLAGPTRSHGYVNPSIEFTRKVKSGQTDWLPNDLYDDALQACELLASFWEGESVLDGMSLARNALVFAVLNDDELRPKAFANTLHVIASCHKAYENALLNPLE